MAPVELEAERTASVRSKSNIWGADPHWLASASPPGQLPVSPGLPPGGPDGGSPDGGPPLGGPPTGGPPKGGGGGPLGGLGLLLASIEETRIRTNATAQSFMFECQICEDKLEPFIVRIVIRPNNICNCCNYATLTYASR